MGERKAGAGGWSQTTPPPAAPVQSSHPSLSGNINTITSGLRVPPPASHICQGQGALVSAEGRRQGRPGRSWDWGEVGGREASESWAQPQVREGPKPLCWRLGVAVKPQTK